MIDHVGVSVHDAKKSIHFYEEVLSPLGFMLLAEYEDRTICGFGKPPRPEFWIAQESHPHKDVHVAFLAPDRKAVHAFYDAGLQAGGRDNGKPGLRPEYHPNYYAAFLLDPDGNNVEAVCHAPA